MSKWRISKEVSYGHILTVVTCAVAAVIFTVRLEGRIDVNAVAIQANKEEINQVKVEGRTQYDEIIRRLERISDKMDLKADK